MAVGAAAAAMRPTDAERYSRQIRVQGIGPAGQQRLAAATVLIVGCGALGTHAAEALARAGVGQLWLCDRDIVEWSNLQRQVLFTEVDAANGVPKAIAAAERLRAIHGGVHVTAHVAECSVAFLRALPRPPNLVLDGTDNFPTRYLLNDWCRQQRVPWIYAGAVASDGAAMVVTPTGPCLRCVWPEAPTGNDVGTCETAGILAPTIAAVSAFQVAEALKLLVGGPSTAGVFTCDVWRGSYSVVPMLAQPAADCIVCSGRDHPALRQLPNEVATLCGRDAVQVEPPQQHTLDLAALAAHLAPLDLEVVRTPYLLRFVADGCRFSVFPGGRALLFGISDPLRAQALWQRWIGPHCA
jgi:molybdopterin-synthase adenylyltransferase